VVSLPPDQLTASGSVAPGVVIDAPVDNGDLAFDILGNLWVTSDMGVVRYDAARLGASIASAPDLRLVVRDSVDERTIVPSNLAFDIAGNLWVIDFGGNLVSKVASSDLAGTGEQTAVAAVTITLGVAALLERPAFDESAGLWLALDQNRFGRLSAAQLAVSSTAGEPTVPEILITSPNMGNANRMALFPAPEGLPLRHRFP
jgi:ligand-binding sensor domain-containing protein